MNGSLCVAITTLNRSVVDVHPLLTPEEGVKYANDQLRQRMEQVDMEMEFEDRAEVDAEWGMASSQSPAAWCNYDGAWDCTIKAVDPSTVIDPLPYHMSMVIGDWSGDGHERTSTYYVRSNKPVEAVREAHFAIKEKTGIDIENVCSLFDEDELPEETVDQLKELGFRFSDYTGMGMGILCAEDMARIWEFLLQKADPELKLKMSDPEKELPSIHFSGMDEKGRHIKSIGYGLF